MSVEGILRNVVGFHVGGGSILNYTSLQGYLKFTNVFQVFISNPVRFDMPSVKIVNGLKDLLGRDLKIVVHSPYLVNFLRENPETLRYTFKYIYNYCRMLECPVVFHTGKSTMDRGKDLKLFERVLKKIREQLCSWGIENFLICLETDVGSKDGSSSGGLEGIVETLEKVGDSRFALCIDTEHLYASGFDINQELKEEYWKWVKVVHLNSIPKEVKMGGHLDRHSETLFNHCAIDKSFIAYYLKECIKRKIVIILERRGFFFLTEDFKYLENLCQL